MLISLRGTEKYQLEPIRRVGEAPVLSHCSLLRNTRPWNGRCTGALSWRRNQMLVLYISGLFLLIASQNDERCQWPVLCTKYQFLYIITKIACKLHQRIPRTFWSHYTCRRTLSRNTIVTGSDVLEWTRHNMLVYHSNLRWILREYRKRQNLQGVFSSLTDKSRTEARDRFYHTF